MTRQFKSIVFAGAAFLGVLAFSVPASAIAMKAVYEGTINAGVDEFDTFGQGNALDGLSYVLTFFYDAATPGAIRSTSATFDHAIGGTVFPGTTNPVQSATFTIGGHSEVATGNYYGEVLNFNDGSDAYGQHHMQQNSNDGTTSIWASISDRTHGSTLVVPVDLGLPYVIAAALIADVSFFQIVHTDIGSGLTTANVFGNLTSSSLTVTRVEEVPLPAALPLLAAGIGAMGLLARKRRRLH